MFDTILKESKADLDLLHSFLRWLVQKGPVFLVSLVTAGLILAVAYALSRFAARAVQRMMVRKNAPTLAPILASLARVLIFSAGFITALSQVGINIGAILAGAGIVGLAVGFGAQTLVKDLLSGFFLIFDDVIAVGDDVKIDACEGTVEHIGLRMTSIRAFDGRLWYVPNGSITTLGNFSRGWGRAIVAVGIGYESDVDRALYVMKQVAQQVAEKYKEAVLEPAQTQGVLALLDSSVTVRLYMKVRFDKRWGIEIELRQRVMEAFAKEGIDIPYPHQVTLQAPVPSA